MPSRASFRARGFLSVVLEPQNRADVRVPRVSMAVPPPQATADFVVGARAPSGAFFAPSELRTLGGVREPRHILTLTNGLTREAIVFVDDLAVGWVASGGTSTFVGFSAGPHAVRGRSFDGMERSRATTVSSLPATVRVENAPALAE
jgi:hypothetical protein